MGGPGRRTLKIRSSAGLLLGHKRALLFQCLDTSRLGLSGKAAFDPPFATRARRLPGGSILFRAAAPTVTRSLRHCQQQCGGAESCAEWQSLRLFIYVEQCGSPISTRLRKAVIKPMRMKPHSHHDDVLCKAWRKLVISPKAHDQKDTAGAIQLAQLNAHIETAKSWPKAVGRSRKRSLVPRPVPWKKPKISVAILVLGCTTKPALIGHQGLRSPCKTTDRTNMHQRYSICPSRTRRRQHLVELPETQRY